MTTPTITQLPIPSHFDAQRVGEVWRVLYQERATQAKAWAKQYGLQPAAKDKTRICLMAIDVQNTFCIPRFELFVGGQSGNGAVEDNVRLCQFIYHIFPISINSSNLLRLTVFYRTIPCTP